MNLLVRYFNRFKRYRKYKIYFHEDSNQLARMIKDSFKILYNGEWKDIKIHVSFSFCYDDQFGTNKFGIMRTERQGNLLSYSFYTLKQYLEEIHNPLKTIK